MNNPSFLPKGLIGHVVDIYRLIVFDFTNPHSFTKFRQINSIRKKTNANILIETGTYLGVTAKRCSRVFKKVITIELDHSLATNARNYLKSKKNVVVVEGDALKEIGNILDEINSESIIVFLDGHFSGGETAKGDVLEPAVEELIILEKYERKIKGIIIDDFREFGSSGWPKKSELIYTAEKYFEKHGFIIYVHLDQLILEKNEK